MNLLLTFLYASLYVFAMIKYWKKYRALDSGFFVLSLWTLSAVFSIYFLIVNNEIKFHDWKDFQIMPFIYLFFTVMIFIYPVLTFKEKYIQTIWTNDIFANMLSFIISIVAIFPFCQNLIQLIITQSGEYAVLSIMEDRYTDDSYDALYYMSGFIKSFDFYNNNYFNLVSYGLLFYQLTKPKINRFLVIGLSISIINLLIKAINIAARFILVTNILLFLYYYIILKNKIDMRYSQILKKCMIYIGALSVIGVLTISIIRFTVIDSGMSIFGWIAQYISESHLNFNGYMWDVEKLCYGQNSLPRYSEMFGFSNDPDRDFRYLSTITGIRMNIFYTMVGDLFSDFGAIATFLISIGVCVFFKIVCSASPKMRLSQILMLGIIAKTSLLGFTYFTFENYSFQLISTIIIALILYLGENFKRISYER